MRGILASNSHRSLAPANVMADNSLSNRSTWFVKDWRHRTTTSPNHCPTICCQDDYFYCFYQYKPALQGLGVADSASGHRAGSRFKYLFHQHRAVCETPVLPVRSGRAGRRIDEVDLL